MGGVVGGRGGQWAENPCRPYAFTLALSIHERLVYYDGMSHTSIFKSYDIRGIVPTQLNVELTNHIGAAYVDLIRRETGVSNPTIVVGGDMRTSTPDLKQALMESLATAGAQVRDAGLVSTPTFYFAVAHGPHHGGIQVSASHNPKEYNGLKMVRAGARPIGKGNGMEEIERGALEGVPAWTGERGSVTELGHVMDELLAAEAGDIDRSKIKPFKIVVDAANAMGALDVEAMFRGLPCELVKMNFELDGNFPAHQPDPLDEKNLAMLSDAVKEHGADFGIAPDGDGDRYFFVDEHGDVVRQEILRGIMAQIALAEHPGATVCYDIRPGRITRDLIEEAGGKAVVTRVGHSLIKQTMLDHDAVFGGESSGHYFYKFPFGTFEAPVPFVLKFLVWLSDQNKTLSQAVAPYRERYAHSGEINSTVANVPTVLERIKTRYADAQIDLLDGVTVTYPDFWFNVRGSNTEPLIRLNLEATSRDLMEQKRDEVLAVIREE